VNNLLDKEDKIKPEVVEEFLELMDVEEVEAIRDYEEWMDNQIHGHLPEVFKPKRVNRRKYSKGKTLHTKCRIAGAIKKILADSKGAKAHITCRKIMSFTELSQSTVRRYLYDVLDWMVQEDIIRMEVDKAKGYYAWTEEWETMVKDHGDLFEPKKFLRNAWMTKAQIPFATALKKLFQPPPCQNLPPRTLKGDYHPSLRDHSDSKSGCRSSGSSSFRGNNRFNKRAKPRELAKIARNLMNQNPLSKFDRLSLSNRQLHHIVWNLLIDGYWRKDVLFITNKALKITNDALADGLTNHPQKYIYGVIDKLKLKTKKPTRQEINKERKRFWKAEREEYIKLTKEEGMDFSLKSVNLYDLKIAKASIADF